VFRGVRLKLWVSSRVAVVVIRVEIDLDLMHSCQRSAVSEVDQDNDKPWATLADYAQSIDT
jgi:hypothetical protein